MNAPFDYEYLDSGDGARLERFGEYLLARPAPVAIWRPGRPRALWREAHATFSHGTSGGGGWTFNRPVPDRFEVRWRDVTFELRLSGLGHLGIFPEQAPNWEWLRTLVSAADRPLKLLNLFAYTGGTTLAVAAALAEAGHLRAPAGRKSPASDICHVDAVRSVVRWASENATHCGLNDAGLRWIVEDAHKYVQNEIRRERRYDLIVLDPPTFGRGRQGQVFKLERDLAALLDDCFALLSREPLGFLLTCHTPGIVAPALANLLAPLLASRGGQLECGDSLQTSPEAPLPLPCGVFARWRARSS